MISLISKILPYFKFWKIGAGVLLTLGFLLSFHLAKSRGEKLELVEQTLKQERQKFQSQIKTIEKAVQDDKERQQFRKSQNKKLKFADDNSLHDAYKRLRERQASRSAG